jgi:hypothetical protein
MVFTEGDIAGANCDFAGKGDAADEATPGMDA